MGVGGGALTEVQWGGRGSVALKYYTAVTRNIEHFILRFALLIQIIL